MHSWDLRGISRSLHTCQQRGWAGKEKAFIYDYIDYEVPILRIMYSRRSRTYRALGLIKGKVKNNHIVQVPQDQLALF